MTPPFLSIAAMAPSDALWTSMLIFAAKMSAPWNREKMYDCNYLKKCWREKQGSEVPGKFVTEGNVVIWCHLLERIWKLQKNSPRIKTKIEFTFSNTDRCEFYDIHLMVRWPMTRYTNKCAWGTLHLLHRPAGLHSPSSEAGLSLLWHSPAGSGLWAGWCRYVPDQSGTGAASETEAGTEAGDWE